MKLIYYIIIRISLVLSVLLTGWAILFYFAVMDEVNDEVDDSLEDYSEIIIIRALAGEELPSKNTASNNQYFLREVTPSLPVPAEVERERNQVDVLCKLMSEFINSQKQAQLPAPDILQKTTNRVAELEHLIGKYQEKLDSLSEDKTMIIKERVEWERKYYDRDKQNYALLETLKKQGELLEKAKTELRHCKGFFSSANEDVLKELGIS